LVTPQSPARTTTTRRVQAFTGELSYKDTGAFELKIALRQNGLLVDRDVRLLVAHAKVSNRLGRIVRLPLEDATAREFVDAAHAAGLRVHAWTVNDQDEIDAFAALGVDGIMSNWPERIPKG
jgi:glycerophosphoryl diester phosphodiesterase